MYFKNEKQANKFQKHLMNQIIKLHLLTHKISYQEEE